MTDALTVCYRHPDRETGLRCSVCTRPICGACSVQGSVGQFCPDCFRSRGRQKIVPTRQAGARRLSRSSPVTFVLIAVAVGFFLLRSVALPLASQLSGQLAQVNPLVELGEWWRIFTPVLLHASIAHIFFNMYALYQLGPAVEVRYGKLNFLALYLAAAGAGGAFAFHLGGENDVLIGASGAIFGLFGLWLDSAYRRRDTSFGRNLLGNLWITLLLNAGLAFVLPQISWQGHLGGLVAGILIGEAWARLPAKRLWLAPVAIAILAVASVLI